MLKNKIKILFLVIIVGCLIFPSISGEMLFSKNIYGKEIGKVCFKSSLDIDIKEFKFVKNKIQNNDNLSQYELTYIIKNTGKWLYIGKPSFVMRFDNSERVIDRWDGRFCIIRPGRTKCFTQYIDILSSTNEDIDEERYVAGLTLVVEGRPLEDFIDGSDKCTAKYWRDDKEYEPTEPHLIVNTPRSSKKIYKKVDNQNLFYIELPEKSEKPKVLDQRMGWINELNDFLKDLSEGVKSLFYETKECFLIEVWPYVLPILSWIANVTHWFKTLSYGRWRDHDPTVLMNLFSKFEGKIDDMIINLSAISNCIYSCIILPVENITLDLNEYSNWYNTTPWTKPITIKGKVSNVKDDEMVNVSCRGVKHSYTANFTEETGEINFEFNVSSEPTETEEEYIYTHDCTITIKGSKHENSIKTAPLLSHSYSNGVFEKYLSFFEAKKSKEIKFNLTATLLDIESISDRPEWIDEDDDNKIDGYYSYYRVNYTIYNEGPDKYVGIPETHVSAKDTPYVHIDAWAEKDENGNKIEIDNKQTILRSHIIKVEVSENEDFDWETDILEEDLLLEVDTGSGETTSYYNRSSFDPIEYRFNEGTGKILYVGGKGEGNFSSIQDAVDNASNNDTIFVYNGSYFEKIKINKSINLFGESTKNTSIVGDFQGSLIHIIADGVNISGFTIKNSDKTDLDSSVIKIDSDKNVVYKNIISSNITISQNKVGICLCINADNNLVKKNKIYNSDRGINIESSHNLIIKNIIRDCNFESIIVHSNTNEEIAFNNSILNNTIYEAKSGNIGFGYGILLHNSPCNLIKGNIIRNKFGGILLEHHSDNNKIIRNSIYKNNLYSVRISSSNNSILSNDIFYNREHGIDLINKTTHNITVYQNNFHKNDLNCYARECYDIHWKNYYSDWIGLRFKKLSFLPYMIPKKTIFNGRIKIPRFSRSNFDCHPAKEPYEMQ